MVPENFAAGGIEGSEAGGIAGEEQPAGGCENAAGDTSLPCRDFVFPFDIAGVNIEGKESRARIESAARAAAVAFGLGRGVVEIGEAVAFGAVEIEELGFGI